MRLPSDVVVGLFILCLCGLLWYLTTRFDSDLLGLVGGMPATAMPRLVIYIISALCLLVIINGWRSNGPAVGSFPAWQMWATAGLLGLVAMSFRFLGLPLAFFAVCLLLPLLWGVRNYGAILVFALLVPTAIYLIFRILLGLRFPVGPLSLIGM